MKSIIAVRGIVQSWLERSRPGDHEGFPFFFRAQDDKETFGGEFGKLIVFVVSLFALVACTSSPQEKEVKKNDYPSHWWSPLPNGKKKSWEISPASVQPPVVVLSKRNELGLLSNFAETPFLYRGQKFASVEGLWQSTKYPDPADPKDPRRSWKGWKFTRKQVEQMTAFDAKRAGSLASKMMKAHGLNWVSFQGERMLYKEASKGAFYKFIRGAMEAKVSQNKKVAQVLESTGNLIFVPDHRQQSSAPPAWKYHEIYMEIRMARRLGK